MPAMNDDTHLLFLNHRHHLRTMLSLSHPTHPFHPSRNETTKCLMTDNPPQSQSQASGLVPVHQSNTLTRTLDNLTFCIHPRQGLGKSLLTIPAASHLCVLAGDSIHLWLAIDGRTHPRFIGDVWSNRFQSRVRAESWYKGSRPRCCLNSNRS